MPATLLKEKFWQKCFLANFANFFRTSLGDNFCTFTTLKLSLFRVFSGLYFPAFGSNKDIYSVNLRIQFECRKILTRKTPNTDTFYEASISEISPFFGKSTDRVKRFCDCLNSFNVHFELALVARERKLWEYFKTFKMYHNFVKKNLPDLK